MNRWQALREWQRFLLAESHVLQRNPALLFQQAANQPDSTTPARPASERQELEIETRPWLQYVNKPQALSPCLLTIQAHAKGIRDCRFTKDGKHIVSASGDTLLKIWDAESGVEKHLLSGHEDAVCSFSLSPNGNHIISASSDGALKLWDINEGIEIANFTGQRSAMNYRYSSAGKLVATPSNEKSIAEVCRFSPDGKLIALGEDNGTLKLIDALTQKKMAIFIGHESSIRTCAFSPDGRKIVSASNNELKVWDVSSRSQVRFPEGHTGGEIGGAALFTLRGHEDRIWSCSFSADGEYMLSSSEDCTIKLWNSKTGQLIRTMTGHKYGVHSCAFNPKGNRIVSVSDDLTIRIWDAATGKESACFSGHPNRITCCSFSYDGSHIATGSSDGIIKIWNSDTISTALESESDNDRIFSIAVSPDDTNIVSGSQNGVIKLWNAQSGSLLHVFAGHKDTIRRCAFSPSGDYVLSASVDGTLKVWDVVSKKEKITLRGHLADVTDFAFSPDGTCVVSASEDHSLKIWNFLSGKIKLSLVGHCGGVTGCVYTPDGRRIISSSLDKTLRIWDAKSGKELASMNIDLVWGYISKVAVSPDGNFVVAAVYGQNFLPVWDTKNGSVIATLKGHEGYVFDCACSQNGQYIVSASSDKKLIVWDTLGFKKLHVLSGHQGNVSSCSFSPNSRWIASSVSNETWRIWEADTGSELCEFEIDGTDSGAFWSPNSQRLIASTKNGRLLLLKPVNFGCIPLSATAWSWEIGHGLLRSQKTIEYSFGCPVCRKWSQVQKSNLGQIIICLNCKSSLKLNPFVINADWRPIAEAWKKK